MGVVTLIFLSILTLIIYIAFKESIRFQPIESDEHCPEAHAKILQEVALTFAAVQWEIKQTDGLANKQRMAPQARALADQLLQLSSECKREPTLEVMQALAALKSAPPVSAEIIKPDFPALPGEKTLQSTSAQVLSFARPSALQSATLSNSL
jgi:hypothetical protein